MQALIWTTATGALKSKVVPMAQLSALYDQVLRADGCIQWEGPEAELKAMIQELRSIGR